MDGAEEGGEHGEHRRVLTSYRVNEYQGHHTQSMGGPGRRRTRRSGLVRIERKL